MNIKILIVDDHKLFRQTLANAVSTFPSVSEVLDLANGEQALDFFKNGSSAHIVILDLQMPGISGREVCVYINRHYPSVKIIILSMMIDNNNATSMLKLGASCCLSKDVDLDELERCIYAVFNGYQQRPVLAAFESKPFDLSTRELEVLHLIVQGLTTKEVALMLNMSPRTIDSRRESIYKKLGARNSSEAIHVANAYLIK